MAVFTCRSRQLDTRVMSQRGLILLCTFLVLTLSKPVAANPIDSLRQLLPSVKKTDKAELLNEISESYRYQNPDSSIHFGRLAKATSLAQKQSERYLDAVKNIGIGFYIAGQYDSALAYVEEFFQGEPKDIESRSSLLNLKGLCLLRKGENKGAMDAFFESLKEADKLTNTELRIKPLTNIGLVYMELNQMNQAIEQFRKALILLETQENLGIRNIILADLAACFGAIDELDSARYYAETSYALAVQLENPSSAANALNILSTYYQHMNKLDSAALMLLRAKPYRKMQADPYLVVADEINLAQIYLKQGKYTEAKKTGIRAKEYADSLGVRSKFRNLLLLMAQIAEAENNWKEAAHYYARWGEEKDSIYAEANSDDVAQQEKTNIELRAARQEEARKNEEKNLIILLILAVFAGATIISILLLKRKKDRDRIALERLESEHNQKLFKAWIEGESKERVRLAKELHDGLGQLLVTAKMSLDMQDEPDESVLHSIQILNNSIDELRHISHDLMPATLMRLGLIPALRDLKRQIEKASTIVCRWTLPEKVEIEEEQTHAIYRIVQEFLNNSLKHAEASELTLKLEQSQKSINIYIADNGRGFDSSTISQSSGMGWNSILLRVNLYQGSLTIDSQPGKGTMLSLTMPFSSSK